MDDRRRRLDRDQRGTRSPTQDCSRPWTTDAARGMSERPSRPWQRPPQFQHGHHDNAFGDAESTGALFARLAAAREWEDRPTCPTRQHPRSSTLALVPFERAHDAAVAYLDLLDQVLEARVITVAEVHRLRRCATDWGISALEAACLHRGYVASVWERACTDATVTPAELRDIETLADLLGIPFEAWQRVARGSAGTRWFGMSVEPDTVGSGPAPWSAPVPSSEEPGQGADTRQGDAAAIRSSRTHEGR